MNVGMKNVVSDTCALPVKNFLGQSQIDEKVVELICTRGANDFSSLAASDFSELPSNFSVFFHLVLHLEKQVCD